MNDAQLAVKNWDSKSSRPAAFAVREIAGFNKYWVFLSARRFKILLVWLNKYYCRKNES